MIQGVQRRAERLSLMARRRDSPLLPARAGDRSGCSSSSSSRSTSWGNCRSSRASSAASTSTGTGRTTATRSPLYDTQFVRSFLYAGTATLLCLLIAYPLAYAIAFKAGRWRNVLLFAVVAPFFTTYLIRTIAWETILSDDSPVIERAAARSAWRPSGHVLATGGAVIAGLTYNFLPVHDPAALREPRADRRAPDRGGQGPLRAPPRRASCG